MDNHEPQHHQMDQYSNNEINLLDDLFTCSSSVFKFLKSTIIAFSLIGIFLLLIITLPILIPYYLKGDSSHIPIVFTVNGESYPDLSQKEQYEFSSINLDDIPVEE